MGKLNQRAAALVAAAALWTLCIAPAFASQADPPVSITIHKLLVDASKDLAHIQDGTRITDPDSYYVYGDGQNTTLNDLTGINGISFSVTRVEDGTKSVDGARAHQGAGSYNKTLTTRRVDGEDGIAVFEGLPYGTYLVAENPSGKVEGETMRFLVQAPMTNPKGDGFLHDIHIYPKNTKKSTLQKEVAAYSSQTPNKVTWRFVWEIPSDIEDGARLRLTDELDHRLSLEYIGGKPSVDIQYANRSGSKRKLGKKYYEVEYDRQDNTVTVTIDDPDAFGELAKAHQPEDGRKTPVLLISLATAISGDAKGTIYNSGTLEYLRNNGTKATLSPERDPSITVASTGGLLVYKYDGATNLPLGGARFRIFSSRSDALAGRNPIGNPADRNGEWPPTGSDGYTGIGGLAYDEEGTIYWLVETVAPVVPGTDPPQHYNLLPGPFPVRVDALSHLQANRVEVENNLGLVLSSGPGDRARVPDGGGGGSLLWRAGGVLLLLAGVVLAARWWGREG